jgi:Protein of unknown function (DUF3108)
MVARSLALFTLFICLLMSGRAFAEDAGSGTTQITADYRVYFASFHLGDVRLTMALKGSEYQLNGEGRFSVLGGLIYEWRGTAASSGRVTKSGAKPSMYMLSYSGGGKHGDTRISFGGGAVTQVSISPKGHSNPHDIPVTKAQLKGVLDPMTGAFFRPHPNLPNADLRVCNETIPAFDGTRRFDLILTPKERVAVKNETPGYSGFAAVCRVKFVPISGYRPDDSGVRYMSKTDEIEAWLIPMAGTTFYLPYRISMPTGFGPGSAELTSFQVDKKP